MHTTIREYAHKCIYHVQQTIPIMASDVLFKRQFPEYGYEVRTEMVDNPAEGAEPIEMLKAYTMSGNYIGTPYMAKFMCEKMGIAPELATPESNVCTIGFCENNQMWYGWGTDGVMDSFGIGSSAKRVVTVDITDEPPEDEDTSAHASNYKRTRNHKRTSYPAEPVQEEWTAKTLDNARRMAIDFAESVS